MTVGHNLLVLAIRFFGEPDRLAHRTQIRFSGVLCIIYWFLLLFFSLGTTTILLLLLLFFSHTAIITFLLGPRYLALRTWVSGLGQKGSQTDGQSGYPWRLDTIRPCLQARVAAFGSQDLGFKTSINGHWVSLSGHGFQDLDIWLSRPRFQDLNIWLSGPEFQDLNRRTDIGHRKLSILRSSYLFPVTFLCVHRHFSFSRHFSLRLVVTDARTHRLSDFIYSIKFELNEF